MPLINDVFIKTYGMEYQASKLPLIGDVLIKMGRNRVYLINDVFNKAGANRVPRELIAAGEG